MIFDFDYTLADSSEGVIECIQAAQRQMHLSVSQPERIRRTIGLSMPDTLATLNGDDDSLRADEFARRADEFARIFLQRADQVMVAKTHVYDVVAAVLADLNARGIAAAIATTKYRYRIEQILRREELLDAVRLIVGAEDVKQHKPDPACLLRVLETLSCRAEEAVYVGDSVPDAAAAQRAGIDFVLVETGLTEISQFDNLPRVAQLPSVAQLPLWLTRSAEPG